MSGPARIERKEYLRHNSSEIEQHAWWRSYTRGLRPGAKLNLRALQLARTPRLARCTSPSQFPLQSDAPPTGGASLPYETWGSVARVRELDTVRERLPLRGGVGPTTKRRAGRLPGGRRVAAVCNVGMARGMRRQDQIKMRLPHGARAESDQRAAHSFSPVLRYDMYDMGRL